jgi:hypothetical protein
MGAGLMLQIVFPSKYVQPQRVRFKEVLCRNMYW